MAAKKRPTNAKDKVGVPGPATNVTKRVHITAPNMKLVKTTITGTAPLVMCKFSEKAKQEIMEGQAQGSVAKNKKNRSKKDFRKLYEEARHVSTDGWCGFPANGLRAAMIRACKLVGYEMTMGKMSIFIVGDGYEEDGSPLVRIKGKDRMVTHYVRIKGTVDIKARPMWDKWSATVTMQYDADQFNETDIINLLARAGMQVGIGEGRPFSKDSTGMGWGTFKVDGAN